MLSGYVDENRQPTCSRLYGSSMTHCASAKGSSLYIPAARSRYMTCVFGGEEGLNEGAS